MEVSIKGREATLIGLGVQVSVWVAQLTASQFLTRRNDNGLIVISPF